MHALTRALIAPTAAGLVLTGLALPASASSSGNEIVYTLSDNNGQSIVLRDLATRRDTVVLPTSDTTDYDYAELSPAGDKVVAGFDELTPTADNVGIVVVGRDGSGATRLTQTDADTTGLYDISPTFSPDGSTVLFTRIDTNGTVPTFTLMTVAADGTGTAAALPGGAGGASASYSPDGQTVVFVKNPDPQTGTGALTTVTVPGGVTTDLAQDGRDPKYSPNGSTIAFARTVNGTDEIATLTGQVALSLGAAPGADFTDVVGWLPDGQSLIYDALTSTGYGIWAVNPLDKRHGVVIPATADSDSFSGFAQGPAPAAVSPRGAASTFVPVQPTRLLDSRNGTGGRSTAFGPGDAYALQVTGASLTGGGTIPADATSVVLNVTVTSNTAATFVQAYPAPVSPAPATSNLNLTAPRQTRANQVTVAVGENGQVALRNSAGTASVIVDITGYYVGGTTGALYGGVTPKRILDTRYGTGAPKAAVGPGGTVDLLVRGGTTGVPADATAVTLNLTGVSPSASTFVAAYPKPAAGATTPLVSSLNLARGVTAANLVTVKISDDGYVRLFNSAGSVQLLADVAGYYGGTSATSTYQALTPTRFLDTRTGLGAAPITTAADSGVDVLFRGTRGLPDVVNGVVLNVTGTGATTTTNVRAFPSGTDKPVVSNLNLVARDTRANAVVATPGSNGRVRVYNAAGNVNLIADLAGYFTTAAS